MINVPQPLTSFGHSGMLIPFESLPGYAIKEKSAHSCPIIATSDNIKCQVVMCCEIGFNSNIANCLCMSLNNCYVSDMAPLWKQIYGSKCLNNNTLLYVALETIT